MGFAFMPRSWPVFRMFLGKIDAVTGQAGGLTCPCLIFWKKVSQQISLFLYNYIDDLQIKNTEWTIILEDGNYKDQETVSIQCLICALMSLIKKTKQNRFLPVSTFLKQICWTAASVMHINVPKHVFHHQDELVCVVFCKGSCGIMFYSVVSGCLVVMAQSDAEF